MITAWIASIVVAFGLGQICRDWEQRARDRASRDDIVNDVCHPDFHDLGVHAPEAGER